MEVTLTQFFIVCPLVFLAGLIDSIAGGGGLISLPSYLIAGISPHMALGTNKLGSVMGTTMSTGRFALKGYIRFKKAVWFIPAALLGSSIGSNLSLLVSDQVIEYLMLLVLPVVAFHVLRSRTLGEEKTACISERKSFVIALMAAFVIGTYDGFYGPGTGTFLILVLTGAACYSTKEAAGTTKLIILSSNAASTVTFLLNGKVVIALGLAAGICSILGNYIGSGLVIENGQRIVRPVILVVLIILFAKILLGW